MRNRWIYDKELIDKHMNMNIQIQSHTVHRCVHASYIQQVECWRMEPPHKSLDPGFQTWPS